MQNALVKWGYSPEAIQKRLDEIWDYIFENEHKVYQETEDGMGYVVDTGNYDVRTEGMSYAMLLAVLYGKKEVFDRCWAWAKTYMYMEEGPNAHYFAWSVDPSGKKNSYGPAPDGEEFFAMALLLASKKWESGQGIYDYLAQAQELLHYCIRKGSTYEGDPMWDPNNHLIKFIPNCDFTDPSYHVPHFYLEFAKYAYEEDQDFFRQAALASVNYLKTAFHPETGLNPEYSLYDGSPQFESEHPHFYSDAYRTAMNVAIYMSWYGRDEELAKHLANYQAFLRSNEELAFSKELTIEGNATDLDILHPVGLVATTAAASLANPESENAQYWVERFWNTPPRTGERRYYDNFLYAFALLALAGQYSPLGEEELETSL